MASVDDAAFALWEHGDRELLHRTGQRLGRRVHAGEVRVGRIIGAPQRCAGRHRAGFALARGLGLLVEDELPTRRCGQGPEGIGALGDRSAGHHEVGGRGEAGGEVRAGAPYPVPRDDTAEHYASADGGPAVVQRDGGTRDRCPHGVGRGELAERPVPERAGEGLEVERRYARDDHLLRGEPAVHSLDAARCVDLEQGRGVALERDAHRIGRRKRYGEVERVGGAETEHGDFHRGSSELAGPLPSLSVQGVAEVDERQRAPPVGRDHVSRGRLAVTREIDEGLVIRKPPHGVDRRDVGCHDRLVVELDLADQAVGADGGDQMAENHGRPVAHDHVVHQPVGGASVAFHADRVPAERDHERPAVGRLESEGDEIHQEMHADLRVVISLESISLRRSAQSC